MQKIAKNIKLPVLFSKQLINVPTTFGWFLLLTCFLTIVFIPVFKIQSFLALSKPVNSKVLIVEGWVPDYCLEQVCTLYKAQKFTTIIITGGPLEQGSYLKEYKNFATLGAATLRQLGIPDSILIVIPAPYVQKDRTYTSATAFKKWFQ
jgi:hypothetical protein